MEIGLARVVYGDEQTGKANSRALRPETSMGSAEFVHECGMDEIEQSMGGLVTSDRGLQGPSVCLRPMLSGSDRSI